MDNMKLLLNQARYIEAGSSNMSVPVSLQSNMDIIVDDRFNEVVNEYNVYLDEREACTKIRLTADINLLASNIIFNSVTEIVKNEGSNDCICLNYEPRKISSTIGKDSTTYYWGGSAMTDAVMDTQISWDGKDDKNYRYLCGIDIYNNHILRSNTKYASSPLSNSITSTNNVVNDYLRNLRLSFNTLGECANNYNTALKSKSYIVSGDDSNVSYVKRYNTNNSMTFFDSLVNNIENVGGWVGFFNKCQMVNNTIDTVGVTGTDRVLNNESPYKYIDLFPGRDRYDLMPHYNKEMKRYEKNWEYCLVYPYSSTTQNIPFINSSLDTLKILFIDENTNDDDGVYRCIIYTICKHGLNVNDEINLYRSKIDDDTKSELVEGNLIVDEIFDDYSFGVYTSEWVCNKWISVYDNGQMNTGNYIIKHIAGNRFQYSAGTDIYTEYSSSDYLNLDYDETENGTLTHIGSKNLSFAKVVNNVQCKYYVRLFSRFPNFDFYDKEVTKDNIYRVNNEHIRPVNEYAKLKYEKQSTLTKLGFSKNIYGDNKAEIVYNDDIDISVLEDNLGRPLTSLYLMFFKTNYGYKSWYYKNNGGLPDYKNTSVEWSRCFGKLNCGFEFSPYMNDVYGVNAGTNSITFGNVHLMNNIDSFYINGMNTGMTQCGICRECDQDDDEILYNEQDIFYGDLCYYSPYDCIEVSIQDSYHRFNTAQRELVGSNSAKSYFYKVNFTELDKKGNTYDSVYDSTPTEHKEGYYYKPNYEIPIRTFSADVSEYKPELLDVVKIELLNDGESLYRITTSVSNYLNNDDVLVFFDSLYNVSYACKIVNILDINILDITIDDFELGDNFSAKRYKLYKIYENIPNYAESIPGNGLVYRWRDIVQNGFEEIDGLIDEYPFVNGCLYIHKNINIFLRRQDPFGTYNLSTDTPYYGLDVLAGESSPIENGTENNIIDAFNEGETRC